MLQDTVRAVHRALRLLNPSVINWLRYDDPKLLDLYGRFPMQSILSQHDALISDERDSPSLNLDDFRHPMFKSRTPTSVVDEFRQLISGSSDRYTQIEERFLEDVGPPYNTSYLDYQEGRILPHFDPYVGGATGQELQLCWDELYSMLVPYIGSSLLPLSVADPLARRKRSSNLGPYHMKSLRRLTDPERTELYLELTNIERSLRLDPSWYETTVIPGTRITHAAEGSSSEDYNRVILMVDVATYVLLAMFNHPLHDRYRNVPSFASIYGYENIRRLIHELSDDYIILSGDSSRMDASCKWEPHGKMFADHTKRFFPSQYHRVIDRLFYAQQHPLYFGPGVALYGPIGNPSGSPSTTRMNTDLSWILANLLCKRLHIPFNKVKVCSVGDDWFACLPKQYAKMMPDDLAKNVVSTWAWAGFTAKQSKQYVSDDTILFLKRYFSDAPDLGNGMMALGNVLKKLIFDRPKTVSQRYRELSMDVFPEEDVTIMEMASLANSKLTFWYQEILNGKLPPANSSWVYSQVHEELVPFLEGKWRGPDGYYSHNDLEDTLYVLNQSSSYDYRILSLLGLLQSLYQCRYNPNILPFMDFLVREGEIWDRMSDIRVPLSIAGNTLSAIQDNPFSGATSWDLLRVYYALMNCRRKYDDSLVTDRSLTLSAARLAVMRYLNCSIPSRHPYVPDDYIRNALTYNSLSLDPLQDDIAVWKSGGPLVIDDIDDSTIGAILASIRIGKV